MRSDPTEVGAGSFGTVLQGPFRLKAGWPLRDRSCWCWKRKTGGCAADATAKKRRNAAICGFGNP